MILGLLVGTIAMPELENDVERAFKDRNWLIRQIMHLYEVPRAMAENIATVFVGVFGVAVIAVLVSRASKTAEVIEASNDAFTKALDAATKEETK